MPTSGQASPASRVPLGPPLTVTAVLLALVALCVVVLQGGGPLLAEPGLPWLALLALWGLCDVTVLEVQIRREARLVTPSDVVLVLALFLVDPVTTLAVRAVGLALALVVVHRQAGVKLLVNLTIGVTEVALALVVFRASVTAPSPVEAQAWAATYLALVVAGSVGAVAIVVVIGLVSDGLRLHDLREAVVGAVVVCALTGTLGLITVTTLVLDDGTAWLLAAAAAVAVVAFRAYARLSARHRALQRLYAASQAVAGAGDVGDVVRSVLGEARELLCAGRADLLLLPTPDATSGLSVGDDGTGLAHRHAPELADDGWLREHVQRGVASLVDDPRGVAVVVAPLRGASGVLGAILVSDRLGSIGRFTATDVPLLDRVAEQAAAALERGRLLERLRHEGQHDSLTGLANRARLEVVLDLELDGVAAGRSRGLALLLTDLDGFKRVNDTHGHHHGDRLLHEVAARMVAAAPDSALVARLGGDEFAVLLPDLVEPELAVGVARDVLAAVGLPFVVEGVPLEVRGSTGVALAPDHGTRCSDLLRAADDAMYAAKAAGDGVRVQQAEGRTEAGRDIR